MDSTPLTPEQQADYNAQLAAYNAQLAAYNAQQQPYLPQQQQPYVPQFPQAAPTQYTLPYAQQMPPVVKYNTRGFLTMQSDYSLGGVLSIDVVWMESLIARYRSGDMGVIDIDNRTGVPSGMLKLSFSAKYSPSQSGKSTHRASLYVRADLPPRV